MMLLPVDAQRVNLIRLTRYWNVDTHENDLSNRR